MLIIIEIVFIIKYIIIVYVLNTLKFEKLNIKDVEKRIEKIIKKLNLGDHISLIWLKDFIYNFNLPNKEVSKAFFGRIFKLLPKNISEEDMNEAVLVFNDAWNCFPQKIMGDTSPQDRYFDEMLKEDQEIDKKIKGEIPLTPEEKLWKDHFDRAKKELDPYLDWAFKEVMPKYDKYIRNQKHKKVNDVIGVAGIFLEICGQMGFFEFSRIHPGFIEDFPNMFLGSVEGPVISKKKVKEYLDNFLLFLETYYPVNSINRKNI